MGSWTLVVHGHGVHHNGKSEDAEVLAVKVKALFEEAGHTVERADITIGGRERVAHNPEQSGADL